LSLDVVYTSKGGTLLIYATGSGWTNTRWATIGMTVLVDGTAVGSTPTATSEVQSHRAFVANPIVVTGLAAGAHVIRLSAMNADTMTDSNDYFSLTVLELP
jgi:hypothetical protein